MARRAFHVEHDTNDTIRPYATPRPYPPKHTPTTKGHAMPLEDSPPLMKPGEVAELFDVNPKTVTRWARAGRISSVRTLGGHRRFRRAEVLAALERMAETGERYDTDV